MRVLIAALAALLALPACAELQKKPDTLVVQPVDFREVPGWGAGDSQAGALGAFVLSCEKFANLPDEKPLGDAKTLPAGTVRDWRNACNAAMNTPPEQARSFFQSYFIPFRLSNNGKAEGLFTGYYEAELHGSWQRSEKYRYPVYKLPLNVKRYKDEPFFSREEIDNGALRGQNLELLYVDDPVALFFAHVQGSARVRMEDGTAARIGYAGQNGHTYHSIGKYLVDRGVFSLQDVTAPRIREWLYAHPESMMQVLHQNPSYIFFRKLEEEGPVGAQGTMVTAEHTLAVDTAFVPLGVPLWLDSTLPVTRTDGRLEPYRRLMVAQDKGSAIKGPVRGDVFFGHGDRATALAGMMKQPGTLYALVPQQVAARWRQAQLPEKISQ